MSTRILMVDDEADFTHLMRCMLEAHGGFSVRAENDPARAVAAARAFAPDLILLDVMMPGTDGTEVAAYLRDAADLCDTPVVFLTALASPEDAPAAAVEGRHLCLPKSVPILTLIEHIEQELAGRPAVA